MDTSRVSRRLAIFVLAMGWAFRLTAADEPRAETVPAVEQLFPPCVGEAKLQSGEPADVLLEIREHLGPSILEGTLFQHGNPRTVAWVFGPDQQHSESDRAAFVEYIRALAAEQPMSGSSPSHEPGPQHSMATCGVTGTTTSNATGAVCTHQAILASSQTHMQTAATISALRGAARQLEVTAGDIEDFAQGSSIEAVKLACKRSDELREVARSLREVAYDVMDEGESSGDQLTLSHVSGSSCATGHCTSSGATEAKTIATSKQCGADCDCQGGAAHAASVETRCFEVPIISKLPLLSRLFTNAGVAPCEAMPSREFGVPISPHSRVFTAVRIAPPTTSTCSALTAAELEATIDQLAEELNDLRSQLKLQTSRRVVEDATPK